MNYFDRLEQQVSSWPEVSIHPHRFGGRKFRFGSAEIGHIHRGGVIDIPFPDREFEVVIMIAVVIEEMDGSD